jgi:hypothetical protein
MSNLRNRCIREQEIRNLHISNAHGWFGVNQEKLKKAQSIRMPSCDELQRLSLM